MYDPILPTDDGSIQQTTAAGPCKLHLLREYRRLPQRTRFADAFHFFRGI